ncbi:hypothetical protein RY831_22070 [Noviherbaspirillum sp. CPCC 100848]|uniref:Uncharacterized protein n=1 Tax=Noviherbaspirillum album TaxID=3080276 RepID=A0ABU6JEA6_9BURK|nr:hypothetical protein [Noviherbaspirillum sp. CPCC 100848]MEC4721858.1 hypothetical protein [Noviherbaspirillum sp. CPCC 100848]
MNGLGTQHGAGSGVSEQGNQAISRELSAATRQNCGMDRFGAMPQN